MVKEEKVKISIVIPTYNRARILKENLRTFISQDYPSDSFEIIIVDDGSKDKTKEAVEEIVKQNSDKNISFYSQKNAGPATARNLGVQKAKGKIIAFSDDDNQADKNWLKEIEKSFEEEGIVGVGGQIISLKEKVTAFTHQIDSDIPDAFPGGNVAYRKEVLEKVGGYDKRFRFSNEDNELAMAIGQFGKLGHNSKMIVYDPPKRMNFKRDLKGMIYLESEFILAQKHPAIYREKMKNPWLCIYYNHFIKIGVSNLVKKLRFFFVSPLDYLRLILLVFLQRVYLIILLPYFIRYNRRVYENSH